MKNPTSAGAGYKFKIDRANVVARVFRPGFSVAKLDQLVSREKISELECRRLRSVRTMRAIIPNVLAEITANCARRGFGWIGSAHGVAPLEDCSLTFERQHHHFSRTHEFGQLAEKTSFAVYRVKSFGLFSGEPH